MSRQNIVDRQISRGRSEISLSSFAFLFSEYVQYCRKNVDKVAELEKKLSEVGYTVGLRFLELICYRERNSKRVTDLLGLLSFISSTVWKVLFGKQADAVEKSRENECEYMISENDIKTSKFISASSVNTSAFVAGIVEGVCDGAEFVITIKIQKKKKPAKVTAHSVTEEGLRFPKTVILIKFDDAVINR